MLGDLVGSVQVSPPSRLEFSDSGWIRRRPDIDDVEVGAELPRVGDLVIGAGFEAVVRNAGELVAGHDEDVAVGIGIGVER